MQKVPNHGGWVFLSINWDGFLPHVFFIHYDSLKFISYSIPKVLKQANLAVNWQEQ